MKQGYLSLLQLRDYRIVLTANFINRLGDAVDMITFTWLIYNIPQATSCSALFFCAASLSLQPYQLLV